MVNVRVHKLSDFLESHLTLIMRGARFNWAKVGLLSDYDINYELINQY